MIIVFFRYFKKINFRADSEGLSEQKRLEGLITRYKSMIPMIETTMVKIEIYSKSHSFRAEIKKVKFNAMKYDLIILLKNILLMKNQFL